MNYRHAFHAGNFADCVKHALLVWLMDALQRKPAPLFVLDTHAGAGTYLLTDDAAQRTGEAERGILRLLDPPPPPLERYVGLVRQLGLYPGSPWLIRALLRDNDRMACCELHPADAASLRALFRRDRLVSVHHRDAWEALGALLPPQERRGLILVDPPYEDPDEYRKLADGLVSGWTRFRTGTYAAWYPVKHRAPVTALVHAVQSAGIRDVVAAELLLRAPLDPTRLNGCGLLVINPPYRFEQETPIILDALLQRFGATEYGATVSMERIVDE